MRSRIAHPAHALPPSQQKVRSHRGPDAPPIRPAPHAAPPLCHGGFFPYNTKFPIYFLLKSSIFARMSFAGVPQIGPWGSIDRNPR